MTALSNASTFLLSSGLPGGGGVKMFVRGALAAAPAWAAVAAVFPAGEALAQRNACGALSSGAATCSNQAYASGIRYDLSDGQAGGVAGNVTLTVTGGAATTITSAAPASTNSWGSGIVVRAAEQGSGVATTRNIVLNAATGGNAGNAVTIMQRSSITLSGANDNTGVVVHQRGRLTDATTVRLGSGVTIGSATTSMTRRGIYLLSAGAANTGAQRIESAATIHAGTRGIDVDQRGRGNVTVTNSGAISASWQGIRVQDDRTYSSRSDYHLGTTTTAANLLGSARLTDTTTTVTNSGSITVASSSTVMKGIEIDANGLGRYRVVNTGAITIDNTDTTGQYDRDGRGIYIDARWHRGHAEKDDIQVESSGDITVAGRNSTGIHVFTSTAFAGNRYTDTMGTNVPQNFDSSGDIEIETIGGTITASGTGGVGIHVIHDVASREVTEDGVTGTVSTTASIENAAAIKAADYGILMDTRSPGDATVTNSGAVEVTATTGASAGVRVWDGTHNPAAGTPVIGGVRRTADTTVKVTNSGAVSGKADGANIAAGHGIWVDAYGPGLFEIVHGVETNDEIKGSIVVPGANAHGIFVDADYHTGAADSLAVKVTSSGSIKASGANGIGIYVRNAVIAGHTVGDANTPDADLGGDIEVTNSGDITAINHGILASNGGNSGAVTVTHSGGVVRSERKTGITAEIGTGASSTNPGTVRVDATGGSVTASASRIEVAVHARTWGTGSVVANVGKDAMLNARHNVGLFAVIEDNADNVTGRVSITQDGKISASAGGVYALVAPASAQGATRAAAQQPVIDIAWTGSFKPPTGAATVPQANSLSHALALDHETAAVKRLPRASDGAGILAEAMSWRTASYHVATADMPTIPNATAADTILGAMETDAANYAIKTAALKEIGETLANTMGTDAVYSIPGVDAAAIDTDTDGALSPAEIQTWLGARDDRHTIMTDALRYAFTDEEAAVLVALAEGNDPTAALAALETALGGTLPANYRDRVTELAGYRNIGDIRIAVNKPANGESDAGRIVARTDGVRALFAFANDNNGSIDITVGEGAEITGGRAGIYVANAGMGSDGILNQHVTVHGMVTGGTDAAVHLAGGGRLTVGRTGKVFAGSSAGSSGVAVLVNDPGRAEIVVDGLVRGGRGGPAAIHLTGGGKVTVGVNGKIEANGAAYAIRGDENAAKTATTVRVRTPREQYNKEDAPGWYNQRVDGMVRTSHEGNVVFVRLDNDGALGEETACAVKNGAVDFDNCPLPSKPSKDDNRNGGSENRNGGGENRNGGGEDRNGGGENRNGGGENRNGGGENRNGGGGIMFNCENILREMDDRRCGLYEALPSVLLAMNALPGYDERLSAARDANGGWALVEGGSGEWKAESATQPDVAYDLSHYGMRGGVELAVGDGLILGVSAHHRRATAKLDASAGEIGLSGSGAGVNATFSQDDGFYADAQAAVTWFDAEIASPRGGVSKGDGDGVSWAAGLEAGKRVDVSDALSVTPRAGLEWSDASLDAFTDNLGPTVSVQEASSLTGRIGVRVDAAPAGADGVILFGAVDVSHLLSQEAEAWIGRARRTLKTTSEETRVRAALGASWSWGEDLSLRCSAHYATSGGDNSDFGGSLGFFMRF